MSRFLCLVLLAACAPQQPTTPSYFHAGQQAPQTFASCQETVACYTRCNPFTEQCMQTCDSVTSPGDAQQARTLTSCVSTSGCSDENCAKQRCSTQIALCTNVRQQVASASPGYSQQPAPYPQQPAPYPQQPAPYPQQQPQQPYAQPQHQPQQPQQPQQPSQPQQPQNPYATGGGLGSIAQAAAGSSPAPASAATTGGLDLAYRVPQGWTEDRSRTDSITLSYTQQAQAGTDFYGVYQYRLVILQSMPITTSVSDLFTATWKAVVGGAGLQSSLVPAPLKTRLKSGYLLALDGESVSKGNASLTAVLYLVCGSDRCVPILGVWGLSDAKSLQAMLETFFESATIKGVSAGKSAIYAKTDFVGSWSTSSATYGSYVNSSGGYAGDASMATGETLTFKSDGTYTESFAAAKASGSFKSKEAGTWKLDDDALVLDPKGRKPVRWRVFAVGPAPDGKRGLLLPASYDGLRAIDLDMPRRALSAEWYRKTD